MMPYYHGLELRMRKRELLVAALRGGHDYQTAKRWAKAEFQKKW